MQSLTSIDKKSLEDVCTLAAYALGVPSVLLVGYSANAANRIFARYGELPHEDIVDLILRRMQDESFDFGLIGAHTGQEYWGMLVSNEEGEVLGMACLGGGQNELEREQVAPVAWIVATQFARTFEQRRRISGIGALNRRIRRLYEISTYPDRGLDWQIHQTLNVLCSFLSLDTGVVCGVEDNEIRVEYLIQESHFFTIGQRFPLDDFHAHLFKGPEELIAFEDFTRLAQGDFLGMARSGLGIRIKVGGDIYGSVVFMSKSHVPRIFEDYDYEIIRLGGHFIGALLEKRNDLMRMDHLVWDLEKTLESQNTLNSLFEITLMELPLVEKLNKALDVIVQTSWREANPVCGIYLLRKNKEEFVLKASRGSTAILENQRVANSPEVAQLVLEKTNLRIPLRLEGQLLGLFVLELKESEFSEFEIEFSQSVGHSLTILIHRDYSMTELLEARKRAEEATELKGYFLASMSHELRTPMNAILGFTERLKKSLTGSVSERDLDCLEIVHKNGTYLLRLINDILDLSKLEAGKAVLSKCTFDLNALVRQVVASLAPLADGKGLFIKVECVIDELEIFADKTKITQVITNLLSNALRYTDEGGVTVALECVASKSDVGEWVTIAVSDTGIGIPEEKLESIFQKFTQIDRTENRRRGGTGLGLAISREYVEMHAGEITVSSAVGKGSIFIVRIPRLKEDE